MNKVKEIIFDLINQKKQIFIKQIFNPFIEFIHTHIIIYFTYALYLLKHKFYVTLECFEAGLIWRGLKHDLDKFSPKSFIIYSKNFNIINLNDEYGYYNPLTSGNIEFEKLKFKHTKLREYHWQHWVTDTDNTEEIFAMSKIAIKEMICDWYANCRMKNNTSVRSWWNENKSKMKLHENTINDIEKRLEEVEAWKILKAQMSDVE